jgi:hypothetical protein
MPRVNDSTCAFAIPANILWNCSGTALSFSQMRYVEGRYSYAARVAGVVWTLYD